MFTRAVFARPFDAHERRNAVLEIRVAHHLIEDGRIRHRYARLAHNLDVPGQGLSRRVLSLVARPTAAMQPGKSES
jgi:hypothetical protein